MEGPVSLSPPAAVDDYGWLECALRIMWMPGGFNPAETVSLFVDDSANREADFLPPVIRMARWTALDDYERAKFEPLEWPSVAVTLGRVRDWPQVQAYASELQLALQAAPFEPYGVSGERGYPELEPAAGGGRYSVLASNGLQVLELTTPALAGSGSRLTELVATGRRLLADQLERFEPLGWIESYEHDLTHSFPDGRAFWGWEVGTQPSGGGSA